MIASFPPGIFFTRFKCDTCEISIWFNFLIIIWLIRYFAIFFFPPRRRGSIDLLDNLVSNLWVWFYDYEIGFEEEMGKGQNSFFDFSIFFVLFCFVRTNQSFHRFENRFFDFSLILSVF